MTVEIRAPGADMTPLSTAIQNIQIYIVLSVLRSLAVTYLPLAITTDQAKRLESSVEI